MAHRLLPFRQYDENDVVNLFSVDVSSISNFISQVPATDGINADGVLVKVKAGKHDGDVNDYTTESTDMFASYSSPVGRNPYPTNPLKVEATSAVSDTPLGFTLYQTLNVDENGEKLLFNPVKKDELQAVLSGQTVPVLTKGIITLSTKAFAGGDSDIPAPGEGLYVAAGGKVSKTATNATKIGKVLTTGAREAQTNSDPLEGRYAVCKIEL